MSKRKAGEEQTKAAEAANEEVAPPVNKNKRFRKDKREWYDKT